MTRSARVFIIIIIIIMNFTTGCDNIMNDMGWLEMVDVCVDRLTPGAGVAVYYKIYWGGGRHVRDGYEDDSLGRGIKSGRYSNYQN